MAESQTSDTPPVDSEHFEELDEEGQRMIELKHSKPDHRDAIQKKTFTKWVNNHLRKVNVRILDLYEELRDGSYLLQLLELLCGVQLRREKGLLRFHRLQNVQTALEFLESKEVKIVNIRSDDIVDGNPKLTLGLIWKIILHFQISDVSVAGQPEHLSAKDALLLWSQTVTEGYPGVDVADFTGSWKDGLAFNAIIHRYRPDLVDFSKLNKATPESNMEYAFHVAETELGVPRLLDVEDLVHSSHPDEKSVMTYVATFYEIFPKTPTVKETLYDSEKLLRYEEYCTLANKLVIWIKQVLQRLQQQKIPRSVEGIKELLVDFNRYRISEFPEMEVARHNLKMNYRALQSMYGPMATWLEYPNECSPRELEVLWSLLVETQDNYSKSLRIELTRFEQMTQVAEKLKKEATLVDSSLDDIEQRLRNEERTDADGKKKRIQQIERSLLMFDSSIKHMLSGSDILIAGHYPHSSDIRIRVNQINERFINIKENVQRSLEGLPVYQSFATMEGKKMKLELPLTAQTMVTEETHPERMETKNGVTTRSSRKIITITKKTYKTVGGMPLEEHVTASHVVSSESIPSNGSMDSGISPGVSPQAHKTIRVQFGLEDVKPGDKGQLIEVMLKWVRARKSTLDHAQFGLDLPSAEKCLQDHHSQHETVVVFQDEVDKVAKDKDVDDSLKTKVAVLKNEYATLVTNSVNRMRHLKNLVEFMSEATKELIWMNQKEEPEVSRDWTRVDLGELQEYGEEMAYDIKEREPFYNAVLSKGEQLVLGGHPAPGPIEAYISAMKSQWWWIHQLIIAFECHFKNADLYQQYFSDAHTAELKMKELIEELNTKFDVQNISSKEEAEGALSQLSVSELVEL